MGGSVNVMFSAAEGIRMASAELPAADSTCDCDEACISASRVRPVTKMKRDRDESVFGDPSLMGERAGELASDCGSGGRSSGIKGVWYGEEGSLTGNPIS